MLVELSVKSQVYDIAKIPCVQKAWIKSKPLRIHGLVYQMDTGVLKDLGLTINKLDQVPEEFWIYDNKLTADLSDAFKKIAIITSAQKPKAKTDNEVLVQ